MAKIGKSIALLSATFSYAILAQPVQPVQPAQPINQSLFPQFGLEIKRSQASKAQAQQAEDRPKKNSNQPVLSPRTEQNLAAQESYRRVQAKKLYQKYLNEHPNDRLVLAQYIRSQLWNSDYATGAQALSTYRNKFGEDEIYLTEKARLFALTNKSKEALTIIQSLLNKHPNNPDLVNIKKYAIEHPAPPLSQKQPEELSLLSKNFPTDPQLALARARLATANYKEAATIYQNYLQEHPDDKNAMLAYIQAELWSGNYPIGEQALANYQKKFGEDEAYLTEKARLLALTYRSKEALTIAEPLLNKNPGNVELIDIKNYAIANPTSANPSSVMMKVTEKPVNPQLALASAQLVKANYKGAIAIYQSYLQKHPDDKQTTIAYIQAQLWGSNYSAAEKILTAYQTKFGIDENYLVEKARLLALTNKGREALNLMSVLLKQYPHNPLLPGIKTYALTHLHAAKVTTGQTAAVVPTLAAAVALEQAARRHASARLFAQAAQAYSLVKQQDCALAMMEQALCLMPDNCDYLKMRAEIANELKQSDIALNSYSRILCLKPNDAGALLGMARTYSAANRLSKAADVYDAYLELYPQDKTAWIEYANVKSWCGANRDALCILQTYCRLFGPTMEYLTTKARVLAGAARPTPALCMVTPLLAEKPDDVDLNRTRIIALYYNNQPVEMFRNLAKLRCLTNNSPDTKGLSDFVTTAYRTNASLELFNSKDTDSVGIERAIVTGQIFITPLTQLLLIAREEQLSATVGSGLNPVEGSTSLSISQPMVGMRHRFTSCLDVEAGLGEAHVTYDQNAFVYRFGLNYKPADNLLINWLESRNFYDVSARAVSLGVKQQLNQITLNWEPYLQRYWFFQGSYSTFTDSNNMWYADLSPKAGILRTDKFDLNVGFNGQWFGFSEQLSNGYYSPKFYQYYSVVANGYLKQSTNVGYGFSLGLGQQKDETFHSFKFAGDAAAVAYFGIYKGWMLVTSAAISNRGRAISEASNVDSNYKIWAFDATLTKRF